MKYLLLIMLAVSLSLIPQVFAMEVDSIVDGTGYNLVGQVIQIHDRVSNPHDYAASASIEFVFKNFEGNNHWESKMSIGEAGPNKDFVAHQDYFVQDVGRFYIDMIYDMDGTITQNPNPLEFIILDEQSKAATNGCGADHELIVKPDYSLAVCVFNNSVEELFQRGWVTDKNPLESK